MLRFPEDGGIGSSLISLEQFRDCLRVQVTRGPKALPAGSIQCRNDYGETGYGGPCPPSGTTHRYLVRVYALNVAKLSVGSDAPPAKLARLIDEHSIGVAQLTVKFGR